MKKLLILLLAFCVVACNAISPNSPADSIPAIPEVTQTPSPNPFLYVTNTPTVFSTPTQTPIPITETARPSTSTPIPSSTVRANLPLRPGQRIDITSIQMIDPQNGWGFDSDYHILRTRDGGVTWQDVTPPLGNYSPAGFFALDADIAWATFLYGMYSMPTTAYVWRTNNGGTTWMPGQAFRLDLDPYGDFYSAEFYFPSKMQFFDAQTGWLLANVSYAMNSARPLFFQTIDGGETWTTINYRIGFPGGCVSVGFAFITTQTGWAGGNCFSQGVVSNTIKSFLSPDGWTISKTTDGGHTYDQKTLMPVPAEFQQPDLLEQEGNCGELRIMSIAANVIGIEWGCSIFTPLKADYRYFALSADGGQTWNSWKATGNEFFLNAKHGWRLLVPGGLQRTDNGGLNWITIKSVAWENAQFDFISEQEGWAIVSNGETTALVHTTNGGKTWAEIKPVIAQ